jgi:hypothetical protein
MKAVCSSETWNTHLQNGVETKKKKQKNYHLINNHYKNMKNYVPETCRMEGWVGSRANVVMLIEKKIPACGKSKTLECQSILLTELQGLQNGMIIADVRKLLCPSVIKKC